MLISGSANLVLGKDSFDTSVEIDIKEGLIRCFPKSPNDPILTLVIIGRDVVLRDFTAEYSDGVVSKEEIKELYFTDYYSCNRVSNSKNDLKYPNKQSCYCFKLLHSKLELDFFGSKTIKNQTILQYQYCCTVSKFEVLLSGYKCIINTNEFGNAICTVGKILDDHEFDNLSDIIRTSFFLAQGNFPNFKEMITDNRLIINLIGDKPKPRTHQFIEYREMQNLINAVTNTYINLNKFELKKFNNTIYYFSNGLNNHIHLEHRAISMCVAFEIIDGSRSLNKNSLKKQLQLDSLYDASFLIKLRNRLIHKGMSIRESITDIFKGGIYELDKDNSMIEELFERNNPDKRHVVVYFFMIDKLYNYLMNKIGFSGQIRGKISSFLI